MQHPEARDHLTDLAEGVLDGALREQMAKHVASCPSCDGWLATYRLIAESLELRSQHPDSEQMAIYAFEPADLSPVIRAEVASHLQVCKRCAQEHLLTRQALDAARSAKDDDRGLEQRWIPGVTSGWGPAALLAATLIFAVVIMPRGSTQTDELTDAEIRDHRVVSSERGTLMASNVRLEESSDLELNAPQGVVLQDGFAVKRGARLRISTGNRDHGKR